MGIQFNALSALHRVIGDIPSNRLVTVRDGSPLASLVKASFVPSKFTGEQNAFDTVIDNANVNNDHAAIMDRIVDVAGAAVNNQLSFVRNQVRESIKEVTERVIKRTNASMEVVSDMEVVTLRYPKILERPLIQDTLVEYKQPQNRIEDIPADSYPQLDRNTVVTIMSQGNPEFEQDILEIADLPDIDVETIYNRHFTNIKTEGYPNATDIIKPFYLEFSIIESLVVYLIARGLENSPTENTNMPLNTHNLVMAQLMRKYGYRVSWGLTVDKVAVDNARLVKYTKFIDETYKIVVYKRLLDAFLNDGGSLEVIYGAYLLGGIDKFKLNDTTMYKRYDSAYGHHLLTKQAVLQSKRSTLVMNAVGSELEQEIRNNEDVVDKEKAVTCLRDTLRKNTFTPSRDDVNEYVMKVTALALWDDYDAYNIITRLNVIGERNPDYTARECALLLKPELATAWIIQQLSVEPC